MVSTSFLHSPHLVAWPLQCSFISHRFGLARVPTCSGTCSHFMICNSNGINFLISRLLSNFFTVFGTCAQRSTSSLSVTVFGTCTQCSVSSLSVTPSINSTITPFFHMFRGVISSSFITTMSLNTNLSGSFYLL